MVNKIFEYGSLQWIFWLDKIIHVLARVVFKCLQGRLVQAETSAKKDILDLKDKSDKKGRGCLESVTCAEGRTRCDGDGQIVYTGECPLQREIEVFESTRL